jgi:SAM-dependent methyltransferase
VSDELVPRDPSQLLSAQVSALLDQAEQALALVTEQESAEALVRQLTALDHAARLARTHAQTQLRVGQLKLRAERRWGELLGPGEPVAGPGRGKTATAGNGFQDRDRAARHRARSVADIDQDVFDGYLATVRDPELLRRARLLRLQREREAEQRRAEPIEPFSVGEGWNLRHGDFRDALDDLTGEVDAIITDPPYGADWLDQYDALGETAARLLRPAGVLVAMVGQAHLPATLERLGRHLRYRWCAAYLTDGPATRIHGRKVGTKWKPLLIYGGERFLTQDVFGASSIDKRHHDWGQSEAGMAEIVERLTEPGELVVDPCLGAGTTAVVCKELGRRVIGCDIDAAALAAARKRLDG